MRRRGEKEEVQRHVGPGVDFVFYSKYNGLNQHVWRRGRINRTFDSLIVL